MRQIKWRNFEIFSPNRLQFSQEVNLREYFDDNFHDDKWRWVLPDFLARAPDLRRASRVDPGGATNTEISCYTFKSVSPLILRETRSHFEEKGTLSQHKSDNINRDLINRCILCTV